MSGDQNPEVSKVDSNPRLTVLRATGPQLSSIALFARTPVDPEFGLDIAEYQLNVKQPELDPMRPETRLDHRS